MSRNLFVKAINECYIYSALLSDLLAEIPQVTTVNDQNQTEESVKLTEVAENGSVQLSKRQIKRQQKKERWNAYKHEKRAEERQKRKDRRRCQVESGLALPPSRKRLKKNKMVDSSCKQKVAIDCSFDDLMAEKVFIKFFKSE